jgi:uncharacterized protein (DUF488 family)
LRLLTIGGYGFGEQAFFAALKQANVDTFVDVRQRRGLRGRRYAFLNSSRLQEALNTMGLCYVHLRELAPTQAIRDLQKGDDAATGVAKRGRACLAPGFVDAYRRQILTPFAVESFLTAVGQDAEAVALFCVEGPPAACHRSLAAEYLAQEFGTAVEHLEP